jgi:hypothetical protein
MVEVIVASLSRSVREEQIVHLFGCEAEPRRAEAQQTIVERGQDLCRVPLC